MVPSGERAFAVPSRMGGISWRRETSRVSGGRLTLPDSGRTETYWSPLRGGGGGGFSPHQKRIRAVLATRGRGEAGRGRGGGVRGPKELHKATAKAAAPLVTAALWRGSPGAAARLPNARSGARGPNPSSGGVPLVPGPRLRLPCPHDPRASSTAAGRRPARCGWASWSRAAETC